MSAWLAALRAFEFLLLLAQAFMRERWKEVGREEVRQEQKEANAEAAEQAAEIDADVARTDLDDLRERMRHYQRD